MFVVLTLQSKSILTCGHFLMAISQLYQRRSCRRIAHFQLFSRSCKAFSFLCTAPIAKVKRNTRHIFRILQTKMQKNSREDISFNWELSKKVEVSADTRHHQRRVTYYYRGAETHADQHGWETMGDMGMLDDEGQRLHAQLADPSRSLQNAPYMNHTITLMPVSHKKCYIFCAKSFLSLEKCAFDQSCRMLKLNFWKVVI